MEMVLVVEDSRELNEGICYALEKEGFLPRPAGTLREAQSLLEKEKADLILLDVNLPDGEGFSFCARIPAAGTFRSCFLRRGIWRRMF